MKYCTRLDCIYVETLGERLCLTCGLYQESGEQAGCFQT